MSNYNYTREDTTEFTDDDYDESLYDATDDVFQSSHSATDRDELDYGLLDEEDQAGPSGMQRTNKQTSDEEEEYISGHSHKHQANMDISDDMSPNATSTGDESEQRQPTPGVSDDVHRMSLAEEAINEQSMEIEEEVREEIKGKSGGKRTKNTQQKKKR